MTYKNGRVPKPALFIVQGIKGTSSARYANQPTAHDYKAFRKAAAAVGVALSIPRWGDYRDLLVQAGLHNSPGDFGSSLSSEAIARAGASSHGLGYNLDVYAAPNAKGRRKKLTQADCFRWVLNNMSKYGFHQRAALSDPHCLAHS